MANKNIVICSDGTGNSTIIGRGTNVFKIYELVDLQGHHFLAKAPVPRLGVAPQLKIGFRHHCFSMHARSARPSA